MAPDRGDATLQSVPDLYSDEEDERFNNNGIRENQEYLTSSLGNIERSLAADSMKESQHFTFRGVLVGILIGIVICFSNMYFGLQTGWISSMAMPSALIGFAFFKSVSKHLDFPFTPVENVLVQSVAGSVGTMPLGCGFVGVIPALDSLLRPEENGPLNLTLFQLIVWALGICFFGVIFAVPLRRQVIIREKLKFPSGTACALMIGVLHGKVNDQGLVQNGRKYTENESVEEVEPAMESSTSELSNQMLQPINHVQSEDPLLGNVGTNADEKNAWKSKTKLLVLPFVISAGYVGISILNVCKLHS